MMTAAVLTPAYTHIHPALQRRVVGEGLPWLTLYKHSDLPRVRSVLIEEGLTRTVQKLILIDADTVPVMDSLARMAETLVTPDRAIFGLYPLREGDRWSVNPEDPEEAERCIAVGKRFRIRTSGLGFCCIHRESLERVAATLPLIVEDTGTRWHPFCVPVVRGHETLSGAGTATYYADDGSLCLRLRESGTELWCDPTLRAAHAVETLIKDIQHGGDTTAR